MSNPIISVIMSVYNGDKYLAESIESVLNQTFYDFEFIIIDDGSTDNSLNILNKYKKKDNRFIIISRENKGLPASLNEGMDIAKGKYIARMDADDISLPNRFIEQLSFLKENHLDFMASNIVFIGDKNGIAFNNYEVENLKHIIKYKDIMPHPTWMMKREVFEKLKGYKNIGPAQDYEFISRAVNENIKIGLDNRVHLNYRVNSRSITFRNKFKQQYNYLLITRAMEKSISYEEAINVFYFAVYKITEVLYNISNLCMCNTPPRWFLSKWIRKINPLSILVKYKKLILKYKA